MKEYNEIYGIIKEFEDIKMENEKLRDNLMIALWLDIIKPTPQLSAFDMTPTEHQCLEQNYKIKRDFKIREILKVFWTFDKYYFDN